MSNSSDVDVLSRRSSESELHDVGPTRHGESTLQALALAHAADRHVSLHTLVVKHSPNTRMKTETPKTLINNHSRNFPWKTAAYLLKGVEQSDTEGDG